MPVHDLGTSGDFLAIFGGEGLGNLDLQPADGIDHLDRAIQLER
jgi:hypothetical protein